LEICVTVLMQKCFIFHQKCDSLMMFILVVDIRNDIFAMCETNRKSPIACLP
jgi:hypothetical protein